MKTMVVALKLLLVMTLITGVVYPLLITGLTRVCYPDKSAGSLISENGRIVGSSLIGQKFESDKYFWPRPSAVDYNPLPSGGSNLGPTSADLAKLVTERRAKLSQTNGVDPAKDIPIDLLFASGSGLDPHISPQAAYFQADRVLQARGLDAGRRNDLIALVDSHIEPRSLGILGEPRVNVLLLNLALDSLMTPSER